MYATCPACSSSGCDCALSRPLEFVRGVIEAELAYLASSREALIRRLDLLDISSTSKEELDRMNGLIHRLWIRFLAIEDLGESFDRAVYRAMRRAAPDASIEQRQDVPARRRRKPPQASPR